MTSDTYDVAIIGGGPAGSTAATLLARAGRKVVVLERDKFPRFHIGESLLPFSLTSFDRLGVREKLDRTFMPKYGGEIAAACGTSTAKFYFKNGFRSQHDRAYQVTRAEFDQILLDNSRESGAQVREETRVDLVSLGEEFVTLNLTNAQGSKEAVTARYLIDCSGRNTVIGSALKLKRSYDHLQKFSIFAHYENVDRPDGIDGTLIRMVRGLDRWFWMIPLSPTRMSIGVVMDTDRFRALRASPEDVLTQSISEHPQVGERMTFAKRVTPVYSAGDYSYRNLQLFGKRWLLAGDAAGFIDPVFSSGVFLAVMSGEKAADILQEVLTYPKRRAALFRRYERRMRRVMQMYLKFVNSWYAGKQFMEVFLSPTDVLQIAPAVNAVLAGNEKQDFAVKWRMWLFYLFVSLQKYLPCCPRLSLIPANNRQSC